MIIDYFIYLFKASAYSVAFYGFYWVALRHTTFHQLNRGYLLSGLLLAFILPWIKVEASFQFQAANLEEMLQYMDEPMWFFEGDGQTAESSKPPVNWIQVFLFAYISIAITLLTHSAKGIISILKIKQKTEMKQVFGIDYLTGPEIRQPFTFLSWIFYPLLTVEGKNGLRILKHEKVHAKQWHTLDLLFVEVITIVLWFNPFVFLFRQSLKQVHEYLADSKVAETPEAKAEYLRLLVSDAQKPVLSSVASQFYWLKLKKRITMITKNKTAKLYKLSYLLIVPIIVITTMSFSSINFIMPEPVNKTGHVPCIAPIKEGQYKISSGYGMRIHPISKVKKMHYAIDLKAPKGTPVIASADGRVIKLEFIKEGSGYGRMLVIQHSDTYSTLYAQLSEFKVQAGDIVKQGDVVGLVGSSGISTGPHLHYEVWKNGEKVNPENYFK